MWVSLAPGGGKGVLVVGKGGGNVKRSVCAWGPRSLSLPDTFQLPLDYFSLKRRVFFVAMCSREEGLFVLLVGEVGKRGVWRGRDAVKRCERLRREGRRRGGGGVLYKYRMSDVHPTSELHPTSDIQHPSVCIRHPRQCIRHPTSDQYKKSCIRHHIFLVGPKYLDVG